MIIIEFVSMYYHLPQMVLFLIAGHTYNTTPLPPRMHNTTVFEDCFTGLYPDFTLGGSFLSEVDLQGGRHVPPALKSL